MSVQIGLIDQRVEDSEAVDWSVNKIGGLPIWLCPESSHRLPECKNCGRACALVTQMYCPLLDSAYHRCVYLFVCPGPCNRQKDGWRVFRCMRYDDNYQSGSCEDKQANQQASSSYSHELWTDEQDDWGESLEAVSSSQTSSSISLQSLHVPASAKPSTHGQDSLPPPHPVFDRTTSLDSFSRLSLADAEHGDRAAQYQENVAARSCGKFLASGDSFKEAEATFDVEALALADSGRWEAMARILNTKFEQDVGSRGASSLDSYILFEPYYLAVVDEPWDAATETSAHVLDLIKNYERSEGKQLDTLISERHKVAAGQAAATELYEKTELKHGDKIFYKFIKRLGRCPQQCIRYNRDGQPLLVASLTDEPVEPCPRCGGRRVFEFQLLPALISHLRTSDGVGCDLEFGTVLVFTCGRNCYANNQGADGRDWWEEAVVLQEDPDSHLFR